MSSIYNSVAYARNRWNREAEVNFCKCGASGVRFKTETWANGAVMVTPVTSYATAAHAIPRTRAIELWRAGWKIVDSGS